MQAWVVNARSVRLPHRSQVRACPTVAAAPREQNDPPVQARNRQPQRISSDLTRASSLRTLRSIVAVLSRDPQRSDTGPRCSRSNGGLAEAPRAQYCGALAPLPPAGRPPSTPARPPAPRTSRHSECQPGTPRDSSSCSSDRRSSSVAAITVSERSIASSIASSTAAIRRCSASGGSAQLQPGEMSFEPDRLPNDGQCRAPSRLVLLDHGRLLQSISEPGTSGSISVRSGSTSKPLPYRERRDQAPFVSRTQTTPTIPRRGGSSHRRTGPVFASRYTPLHVGDGEALVRTRSSAAG